MWVLTTCGQVASSKGREAQMGQGSWFLPGAGRGTVAPAGGPTCGQVPTVEQIYAVFLSLTTSPLSHSSRLRLSQITLPLDPILGTGLKSLDWGLKLSEPQLPLPSISDNGMSFAGRL